MAKAEGGGSAQHLLPTDADAQATIADDPLATVRPNATHLALHDREAYEDLLVELRASKARPYFYAHFDGTLGEGAMGKVQIATQPRLEREVAVKVLKDGHKNDASTLRLLQEAWVTGILEHPHIVPVHEIAVDPDGSPQVVLKRIRGRRWSDVMHDGAALASHVGDVDSFEWNLRTLMTVCGAIQHAHRRGIVHRDIKPENVMIGAHGEVYVVDWGIAVSLRPEDARRIQLAANVNEMSGTPAYMAPEMVQRQMPITHRTDVYQLGATLYQIIVGHAPHHGADLMDLVRKVIASNPPYPAEAPPDLVTIAQRAMAPEPKARFPSADALRDAIQSFLDGRVSARICYSASLTLAKLEEAIGESGKSSSSRRAHLYDLLGACRFGFQQALNEGRNAVAERGLVRAAEVVASFELEQGNVEAAERLVLELDDPDKTLVANLDKAKRRKNRRQESLEALRRDRDPRVGQNARLIIATVLGGSFVLGPLYMWFIDVTGPERLLTSAFGAAMFLGTGAALALWKKEEMTASALNRGLIATIFLAMLANICADAGIYLAGAPVHVSSLMRLLLWFAISAMLAIALEPRLWLAPVAFLLAFFVGAAWSAAIYPAMSLAAVVLVANAVWIWKPRQRS